MTTDLAERYGTGARGRRRLVVVAAVVAVLVFGGWLTWTTLFHATPDVSSELTGWDVGSDGEVTAFVTVDLGEGVDASCTLRAYAADHTTVGEVAFVPTLGRNEVAVRTERRATSVTLLGCTAPGQPRPR